MRVENITIEFISSFNKLKIFPKWRNDSDKIQNHNQNQNQVFINGVFGTGIKPDVAIESKEREPKKTLDKKDYKQHKMDSILYCSRFIEKNPELEPWKTVLQTSSKKDDLADSFLQGMWWLTFHKIINIAEDLNINCVSS
jgi:hypothetical protein